MSAPAEQSPRRRKEVPAYSIIERICHGVDVVEIVGGTRRYHVTYDKGTAEEPLPSHYFFDTIPDVLNNHERVIQRNLGTLIPLPQGGALPIAGEAQRMSELSGRLTTLTGKHIALATFGESSVLKGEIGACQDGLGQVTNSFKVAAKLELEVAYATPESSEQLDALLAANVDIAGRNTQTLRIAQGTLGRWRIVFQKRRDWEEAIENNYNGLAEELEKLRTGGLATSNAREQAAYHVSGSEEGVLAQLNRISGSEYWVRIQDREVQRLATFGAEIREGSDQTAQIILENAILKLWRVVEEKTKRERGEREK